MVILKCTDGLDVVRVGTVVGVDYLSAGHVEMPQGEIVTSRIEIVSQVLESVDSLGMVAESPQLKLLFCIHHLYRPTLVRSCEDSSIGSEAEGAKRILERGDFLNVFGFGRVIDDDSSGIGVGEKVEGVVVAGDGCYGGGALL